MMLSAFNVYVPDTPEIGDVLVHNTFSGAYVVLEGEVLEALEKREHGEALDERELALVDDPELSDRDIGVVVESRDEEARAYRAWFEARRAEPAMKAIVAVNRACNFACTYCCQAGTMDGAVMTQDTIRQTAAWLAERAAAIGAPSLHVTFVGGEPLLHPERIRSLAEDLRLLINFRDIEITLGLITNGYFLDEDMVRSLVPLGLEVAQVTLDGDERTHSRSRVSKRGEDTFARVFDNVLAASRHIRIVLNGNYQADTIAGFGPLIAKLAESGFERHHTISFTPALAILDAPSDSGSGQCTWGQSGHDYRVALHDELLRHGYQPGPLHAVGPCSFHDHHMYVVDVDGALLKCPGFLGHPEWRIGDVERGLGERYRALLGLDRSATCGGCAHEPNCAGGCVANALLHAGAPDRGYDPSMRDLHCEIDFLTEASEPGHSRAYLLATSADAEEALGRFPAPRLPLPSPSPEGQGRRHAHPPPPRGHGVRTPALAILR